MQEIKTQVKDHLFLLSYQKLLTPKFMSETQEKEKRKSS